MTRLGLPSVNTSIGYDGTAVLVTMTLWWHVVKMHFGCEQAVHTIMRIRVELIGCVGKSKRQSGSGSHIVTRYGHRKNKHSKPVE